MCHNTLKFNVQLWRSAFGSGHRGPSGIKVDFWGSHSLVSLYDFVDFLDLAVNSYNRDRDKQRIYLSHFSAVIIKVSCKERYRGGGGIVSWECTACPTSTQQRMIQR